MKRKIVLLAMLLLSLASYAQKKPSSVPSAGDINKMMDQAIKESGATPEEAAQLKKMMENMTAASNKATENEPMPLPGRFPRRDPQRIQQATQVVINSTAQMASYLTNLRQAVSAKLSPSIAKAGTELLSQFPAAYQTSKPLANAAVGCWLAGYPQLGLWIAAQAAVKDPGNANTLNIYSAMLIMLGAEQSAIPMLTRLHAQYPSNYSVLNNLGQAWYGLGEFGKAKPMLDSAIIRYPGCAQAFQARAMINDAAGNGTAALADFKAAIKAAYTQERERSVKKKGAELTTDDLPFRPAPPRDALGLEKLKRPQYPHSTDELNDLKPQWDAFENSLKDLEERMQAQREAAIAEIEKLNELRMTMAGKPMNGEQLNAAGLALPFATKAWMYKEKVMERMTKDQYLGTEEWRKQLGSLDDDIMKISEEVYKATREEMKSCACHTSGEGDCVDQECACKVLKKGEDALMDRTNSLLERVHAVVEEYNRKVTNDDAYYTQYTMSDAEFTLYKIDLKTKYLSLLSNLKPNMNAGTGVMVLLKAPCRPDAPDGTGHGLLDFDSLKCPIENTFWVPGIGSITLRCNQMTTELAPVFLHVKVKYTENWWTGQVSNASFGFEADVTKAVTVKVEASGNFDQNGFVNGTVTVEGEAGLIGAGDHDKGSPVEIGVKGSAGVSIEIDRTGITDVNVTGDIKAGADVEVNGGKSLGPQAPGMNVSGSWGMNAGCEMDGKGTLAGITVAKP